MTERVYRCVWSEDDQQYIATVNSYPSLSALADDEADAIAAIRAITAAVDADLADELANGATL